MSTDTTLASSGLQQPLRGTVATLGIIALATLFISLFTESTFGSWGSFLKRFSGPYSLYWCQALSFPCLSGFSKWKAL